MKRFYIVRGLPGAGKSTYARTLAPLVIEPDMFRYDSDMNYVFDSDKNAEVIRKTQDLCEYAMRHLRMPALAVTATFTKIDHFLPYVRMARHHGYAVTVIECWNSYDNVHGVPEKVIAQMKADWERFDEELANQEGVSLWELQGCDPVILYVPKGGSR